MPGTRFAAGHRLGWGEMPDAIHAWVRGQVGEVEILREHRGGMSPGCAVSLIGSGGRVFVKAVGAALNEGTVSLFRDEVAVLEQLPPVAYRPRLRAFYDDGEWIGIMLEHVDGRPPDLTRPDDVAAVRAVLAEQATELTPPPSGIDAPGAAERVTRWLGRWVAVAENPELYLPAWAVDGFDDLHARVRALPDRLGADCLAHFDVRADNLLIRPDGQAVVIDWGRPHRAPGWTDLALLAGQLPAAAARAALPAWVPGAELQNAVDLLLALAGQEAWWGRQPPPRSLPTLPAFCRDDARALFDVLRQLEGADSKA